MSFVSKGYGGLSSDRHIFEDCGVISKFEQNTACIVDIGFNVQDLLLVKQVKLYMPPFTKGQNQFTKQKGSSYSQSPNSCRKGHRKSLSVQDFQFGDTLENERLA